MATFYITHHLYPDNPQIFNMDVVQVVKTTGEPIDPFDKRYGGEHFWEIKIETKGKDLEGSNIPPVYADIKDSEVDIDEFILNKISNLCNKIDWSSQGKYQLQDDIYPPILVETFPINGQTNLPIDTHIEVKIKENFPAAGIDISKLVFKVKGVNISPSISGNPFEYTLKFSPKPMY